MLAALMVMSVFSVVTASAANSLSVFTGVKNGTTGKCSWSFDENTGTLTISGNGATEDVNGVSPFDGFMNDIKKVYVTTGVTTIGDRFFSNMSFLQSVTLADTVTDIKFCAFMNCYALNSVNIPVSVKNIEERAFQSCEKIQNITIPSGVKEINAYTFYGCKGLNSVSLPNTLKKINEFAFVNTGLTEITIPSSVEFIADKSIGYNYDESARQYKAIEGFKVYYTAGTEGETYAKESIPPDTSGITWSYNNGTLTILGTGETPWAESYCPAPWEQYYGYITKLVIGDGITVVNGVGAPKLKSIEFSDTVETINKYAFQDCVALTDIKFGKALKEIKSQAFDNVGVKSVTFPDSLKKIGTYAFSDSKKLTTVKFGKGIEEIGDFAFYNCPIKTVELPDSLKTIGDEAIGFSYEIRGSEGSDEGSFLNAGFEIIAKKGTAAAAYAKKTGAVLVTGEASINKKSAKLKAGKTVQLKLKNSGVIRWKSSNKKVAIVDEKGKVSALKKGTAVISAETPRGFKFSCKVKVTSNPTIKVGKKKFSAKKTYTIYYKKTITVKITGKASAVKNKYKSSKKKIAKVTSKAKAKNIKIKGLKRGKATITVTVNGVKKFKIKVRVI